MTKLMHVVYILLWSQLMVFCVDKVQYEEVYDWFHVIGLIASGVCAGVQFAILIIEINEGE
jgi:hypothetical protein